jgi:GNAT superfamily N-acetyltransferase
MIRRCTSDDFPAMFSVINDAAQAYRGVIPADRWKEPYMPAEELAEEIDAGVVFWGFEDEQGLCGIMGLQDKGPVTLIRHAYVLTSRQRQGIGGTLLTDLYVKTEKPVLVGTWKAAIWAVAFYRKYGFELVSEEEKDRLLKTFWSIPPRQIETSVVMADERWRKGKSVSGATVTHV